MLQLIDLDTVILVIVGNDFGDLIRYAANFWKEDCTDYPKASANMDVFEFFKDAFLKCTYQIVKFYPAVHCF